MIPYSYPLFRPPVEANNIILQATYGCSYNSCSFCSMYKTKSYQARAPEDIYKDIDALAALSPAARRVFLADGDALSLSTGRLIKILKYLRRSFPKLSGVSVYASAQNILSKTDAETD